MSRNRAEIIRPQVGDKLTHGQRNANMTGEAHVVLPPGCYINSEGYVRPVRPKPKPKPTQEAS